MGGEVHVQFHIIDNLKLHRITCKNFCNKKYRGDISMMYSVVPAMEHCQSPDPVFSKGHCVLVDQRILCGQRSLLATSPQSKRQAKGNSLSLFLQLSTDSADQANLEGLCVCACAVCVCVVCVYVCVVCLCVCWQRGLRTWGGSNFSCTKTVADSAEFRKGGSRKK